jgi:hypothetical protein
VGLVCAIPKQTVRVRGGGLAMQEFLRISCLRSALLYGDADGYASWGAGHRRWAIVDRTQTPVFDSSTMKCEIAKMMAYLAGGNFNIINFRHYPL